MAAPAKTASDPGTRVTLPVTVNTGTPGSNGGPQISAISKGGSTLAFGYVTSVAPVAGFGWVDLTSRNLFTVNRTGAKITEAPANVAVGPNQIWGTFTFGNELVRLDTSKGAGTTSSDYKSFQVPTPFSQPQGIAYIDGKVWFTEKQPGKVGVFDPDTGDFKEFSVGFSPVDIAALGALTGVFIADSFGDVDYVTVDGQVVEIPIPDSQFDDVWRLQPVSGDLWFLQKTSKKVGRIHVNTSDPASSTIDTSSIPSGTPKYAFDFAIAGPTIAVALADTTGAALLLGDIPVGVPQCTLAASAGDLNAQVGATSSVKINATGGTAPYKFAVTAGALPPGMTLQGDTITGAPTTANTYSVTVTVTDSSTPPCTATATVKITVAAAVTAPPISLLKSHQVYDPTDPQKRLVIYTFYVKNDGDTDYNGVVKVSDTLPANLGGTYDDPLGIKTCDDKNGVVSCTQRAKVKAHSFQPIAAFAVLRPTAGDGQRIVNQATATADGVAGTLTATDTWVVGGAQLELTKSHSDARTARPFRWRIHIKNRGTRATSGTVTIRDAIPDGAKLGDISNLLGIDCHVEGGTLVCTLDKDLPAGGKIDFDVPFIDLPATGEVTNYASVDGGESATTGYGKDTLAEPNTVPLTNPPTQKVKGK